MYVCCCTWVQIKPSTRRRQVDGSINMFVVSGYFGEYMFVMKRILTKWYRKV